MDGTCIGSEARLEINECAVCFLAALEPHSSVAFSHQQTKHDPYLCHDQSTNALIERGCPFVSNTSLLGSEDLRMASAGLGFRRRLHTTGHSMTLAPDNRVDSYAHYFTLRSSGRSLTQRRVFLLSVDVGLRRRRAISDQ